MNPDDLELVLELSRTARRRAEALDWSGERALCAVLVAAMHVGLSVGLTREQLLERTSDSFAAAEKMRARLRALP